MSLKSNKDYWGKFVEGNTRLFKKVFKKYYPKLFGYGLKLSNNSKEVEDCIQELFENIWKRRSELDHIESPNVYLFVSLRRKLLKRTKKSERHRQKFNYLKHKDRIEFSKEDLIIKNENLKEQKKELAQALNQLSDRQKEILFLYFYNGLSYREIEEILSINRQSIRNHIYRAMKVLRTFLTK